MMRRPASFDSTAAPPLRSSKAALLYAKVWRLYAKAAKQHLIFDSEQPSDLELDLVVPVAEKDLAVFRLCVEKIRQNLLHPIGSCFVVGQNTSLMRQVCRDSECTFIDENEVCPWGVAGIRRIAEAKKGVFNRPPWLYQQFLKLNMDTYSTCGRFLTFDADTVMLRPMRYEMEGQVLLDVSDGYRSDFDAFLGRMLPGYRRSPFSYMCHIMLMESRWLQELKEHLSGLTGLGWREAIIELIDFDSHDCFSEFELYANFVLNHAPEKFRRSYWFNKEYPRERVSELERLVAANCGHKKTLSMHMHVRGDKR
jgi:hypothetical protein